MKKIIFNYLGLFAGLILLSGSTCESCKEEQEPEFKIDFTYAVEEYNRVVFTPKVSGGGANLEYLWFFSDPGATSDKEEAVHYYREPGDYEVTLYVKSDNGYESITKTITVTTIEEDYGDGS